MPKNHIWAGGSEIAEDGIAFFPNIPTEEIFSAPDKTRVILGVCIASASWWLGLTTVVTLFRAKITAKIFRIINIVCGAFILFYGASLLLDFIKLARTVL